MKVNSNVLDRQFQRYQDEYEQKALEVLRSGWYVLGNEVKSFEQEFAAYVGTKHCVGLASGLDALWLSFRVLGIGKGDEVIVPANTYIASVMGVTMNDATPVFVEPDAFHNLDASKVEEKITPKTKAILAVHLYGQACRMDLLHEICKKHGLYLVEDCAQSHGAMCGDKMTGNWSDIGCFSFYPSKNLGCFGDGGAITTNHPELAEQFRILRNYGSEKRYHFKYVGTNSRLDEIQAGFLRVKLKHIGELNQERTRLAKRYLKGIHSPYVTLPAVQEHVTSIWHLFVVTSPCREELMRYLTEKEIGILIHYPIPPHLSECYQDLGYHRGDFPLTEQLADTIFSLPLYNGMTESEQDYVIDCMNSFKGL